MCGGAGVLKYANGDVYDGEYENGKRNGQGAGEGNHLSKLVRQSWRSTVSESDERFRAGRVRRCGMGRKVGEGGSCAAVDAADPSQRDESVLAGVGRVGAADSVPAKPCGGSPEQPRVLPLPACDGTRLRAPPCVTLVTDIEAAAAGGGSVEDLDGRDTCRREGVW